jgi:hypothetical protein
MPFGLTNAPAIFQALMNKIIGDIEFCAKLLDNIVIWSDSIKQLHKRFSIVFKRLIEYGIMVNVRKTVMFVIFWSSPRICGFKRGHCGRFRQGRCDPQPATTHLRHRSMNFRQRSRILSSFFEELFRGF